MKLELDPKAKKYFNEKADFLLSELVPVLSKSFPICKDSYRPNFPISGRFGKRDDPNVVEFKDIFNFKHNGQLINLKESSKKIEQLSQKMQNRKELHKWVSVTLLTDLIYDWMKDKYKIVTDLSMVDYVLGKSQESIEELEIWIPIAELYIQSEIKIGRVTLRTIKREMFECWRTAIMNANPADDEKIQKFDEEQKKIQELAAATMKVNAEPIRAFEIALEETEKSIGLLRCFSPFNFNPEKKSYCVVFGKENLESTKHLVFQDNNLVQISHAFVDKNNPIWIIDDVQLSLLQNAGLEMLSDILTQEKKTEFQERLLDSLLLYSRSSLMKNPSDKLVYILVALESFLLGNESIQNTISDGMAYFISSNKQERISIVENLKKAYGLRSKFIHHGETIEDLETLKEFMLNVWMFFSLVIQNANRFDNRKQFFKAIEDEKYS
ncbi:MAG: HEPN domain-containing protein [Candidatus Methanoperedens sp.]|nr:HEPN domain-containing protein [Candidatus Methanoperedens sp.]